ncbi:MAG: digeranylgeranylglyceryl phosphate synthase [Candidatus Altiarchaeales archaeon ex4484_2]|nr:MAG: digeranylgeranylglyceryl phosphate synthase [Candidatus Altiarchaeales archaeon ex4484_2]
MQLREFFRGVGEVTRLLLSLMRFRNCVIGFLGVLVGASFTYSGFGVFLSPDVFTAGLAAFLIIGAGNILNDYFDIEIDKINKPNKPLPAGRISKSDALMLSIILFLFGVGLSKLVNHYILYLAALNTVVLILYATYSKRLLFVSNLVISYLVASVFVFGALTNVRSIASLDDSVFTVLSVLVLCSFLMTLSREIIKDIEDVKGDKYKYAQTLPVRFGTSTARKVAALFTLLAVLSSLLPFILYVGLFNLVVYAVLVGLADMVFLASMFMPEYIAQRAIVGGMLISLFAFLLGDITSKISV